MLKILIACADNQIMGVSNKSSLKQPPLFAKFLLRLCLAILGPALIDMPGAEEKHPIAAHGNHELHPALGMSLFAAEPAVVDPVAMTFDEHGRVYVVEMRDYPSGIGPDRRPGGTVRLLEDENGDGQIDKATLFAEWLSFPTSVAPWNGGILVTAPPEILFLKDTDADGKADVREVLFSGFRLGVTDSNVSGLRWGLDNRVHGVNGGNGGAISSSRKPGASVSLRDFDFSFDPVTGDFTTTYQSSGGFGLVFDDWGRSFATYNINHLQHRILPVRYLQRFPGLPPVETTVSISDHGEMSRIYPIAPPETRVNHPEQAGHFSAAGGLGYVGNSIYPGDLRGSVLVCDVAANLVHRDVLVENGPSFVAKRSADEQTQEFFASRDNAFRPIGAESGPDGALYLIDMQRDVIEHPDYIPQKVKDRLDLRAGEDRGRIYRLTPKGGLPARKPRLHTAPTAELVKELANPNQWWRLTAQRLLVERQDRSTVPALIKLATTGFELRGARASLPASRSDDTDPLARLHAFWTLEGLRALDEPLLLKALSDPHPGVRENALLLAEKLLPGSEKLRARILVMADDANARVRFQTALTLGEFEHLDSQAALSRILRQDYAFRWSRLAVLSSLRHGEDQLFRALLSDTGFRREPTPEKLDLTEELADLIGARASSGKNLPAALATLLDLRLEPQWQLAALRGLQTGVARGASQIPADSTIASALEKLAAQVSTPLLAAAWRLSRTLGLPENEMQRSALALAIQKAKDNSQSLASRLENIRLLALGTFAAVEPTLFALLESSQPSLVQGAAVEVLRQFTEPTIAQHLVARWRALAPIVRSPVIHLLLQRRTYHPFLIEALETERIKVGELNLDLEQRRRLLRQSTPEIKARIARFIGDEEYSNRKTVVEEWLKKMPASGVAGRGREIFEKTCAQCHLKEKLGFAVGPDLSDVAHRSVEDLLSNILDPNMAINPNYISYNVDLTSDELESGILQSESGEAITLLQAGGKKVVVPRPQIKRMESTGLSLMPEGLEAGLAPGDLRDLIAFLQEKR